MCTYRDTYASPATAKTAFPLLFSWIYAQREASATVITGGRTELGYANIVPRYSPPFARITLLILA